jgi:hypothetical protein
MIDNKRNFKLELILSWIGLVGIRLDSRMPPYGAVTLDNFFLDTEDFGIRS